MSPYKLQYRVLKPSAGSVYFYLKFVDSVFDDYELAFEKASDIMNECDGVEIQLVLIGPDALMKVGKPEESVLFSKTILDMSYIPKRKLNNED